MASLRKIKPATRNTEENSLRKYTCFCDPRREKYKIGTHQPCVLVLATPLPTVFVPKFLYLWNSVIFK